MAKQQSSRAAAEEEHQETTTEAAATEPETTEEETAEPEAEATEPAAAPKPRRRRPKYVAVGNIRHNDNVFEPGQAFIIDRKTTQEHIDALLASGALREVGKDAEHDETSGPIGDEADGDETTEARNVTHKLLG